MLSSGTFVSFVALYSAFVAFSNAFASAQTLPSLFNIKRSSQMSSLPLIFCHIYHIISYISFSGITCLPSSWAPGQSTPTSSTVRPLRVPAPSSSPQTSRPPLKPSLSTRAGPTPTSWGSTGSSSPSSLSPWRRLSTWLKSLGKFFSVKLKFSNFKN